MFFIHHQECGVGVAKQHKCTEYRRQAIKTENIQEFSEWKIRFCVEIESCRTSFHRFLPHSSSPVIQTLRLALIQIFVKSHTLGSLPLCLPFKFLISAIGLKWLFRNNHAISLKNVPFKGMHDGGRNALCKSQQ